MTFGQPASFFRKVFHPYLAVLGWGILSIFVICAVFLCACSSPSQTKTSSPSQTEAPAMESTAQKGDTVEVSYHGTLDNGEVFDSSRDRNDTLTFTVNGSGIIQGFNDAVIGLSIGQSITVRLSSDEAYGDYDPSLTAEVPKIAAPIDAKIGAVVTLSSMRPYYGQRGTVLDISSNTIHLDLNHPLAGKNLTFEIELITIR